LKEQNKYDQIPSALLDRLQRVSLFADKVADEIVCKETELLEEIIPRMFEVMQTVARVSCDYVKCGRRSHSGFSNAGDFPARTVRGSVRLEAIEEMDRELTKVIEDFDRAVNVETLRLVKETGKHALSRPGKSPFLVVSCRTTVFA
jgi:hypothetical protein